MGDAPGPTELLRDRDDWSDWQGLVGTGNGRIGGLSKLPLLIESETQNRKLYLMYPRPHLCGPAVILRKKIFPVYKLKVNSHICVCFNNVTGVNITIT